MSTSKSSPSNSFSDLYSTILSIKVSTISDVHVYRLDFSLSFLSIFTFVFLLLSLSLLTLLFEVFTSFGEFDDSLFELTILSNLLILTLRLVLRNILCIVMTWKKHGGLGLGRSKTESECSLYPIHYQYHSLLSYFTRKHHYWNTKMQTMLIISQYKSLSYHLDRHPESANTHNWPVPDLTLYWHRRCSSLWY